MTRLGPSNDELDEKLRHALHQRAQMVEPQAAPLAGVAARARSLQRRRMVSALTGPALVLVAVGVLTPTLLHRVGDRPSVEPPQFTTLSSAQDASQLPDGYLGWSHRGANPPTQLAAQARSDWAAVHAVDDDDVLVAPLWSDQLSDGEWVYAFQAWDARLGSAAPVWTVFALGPRTGGPGVIDTDVPTALSASDASSHRVPLVSAALTTGQGSYAVVLGAPGTTQIAASVDGLTFRVEPNRRGVAVFRVSAPTIAPAEPTLAPSSDSERATASTVLVRVTAGNPSAIAYLGPIGCPCVNGP